MNSDLPTPLTPYECDLRAFPCMFLDVVRLRKSKSWLMAKRDPELGFYMMNLWIASWHEVPASSLEDDDDTLADAAMCDPHVWANIRDKVLRGWIKCSDGRLYNEDLAKIANGVWNLETKEFRELAALCVKPIGRPSRTEWLAIREVVFLRDGYRCAYCGDNSSQLHCDHVRPLAVGGSNSIDNLVTACRRCNVSKKHSLNWKPAVGALQ